MNHRIISHPTNPQPSLVVTGMVYSDHLDMLTTRLAEVRKESTSPEAIRFTVVEANQML